MSPLGAVVSWVVSVEGAAVVVVVGSVVVAGAVDTVVGITTDLRVVAAAPPLRICLSRR